MARTIPATRPNVIPARAEAVYDQWVKAGLEITGSGVGTDIARGTALFRRARTLPGGGVELGPEDDVATLRLENLLALAAQYPEVAAALEAVDAALVTVAQDRGIL